jgi:hypothetical protein
LSEIFSCIHVYTCIGVNWGKIRRKYFINDSYDVGLGVYLHEFETTNSFPKLIKIIEIFFGRLITF